MSKILQHPACNDRAKNFADACDKMCDAFAVVQTLPVSDAHHIASLIAPILSARETIQLAKHREFLMRAINKGELVIMEPHTHRELHALLADTNDILEGISYDTK